MKIVFRHGEADPKHRQAEKQRVARIAYRHIRFLKEAHIPLKIQKNQHADGNNKIIPMLFFEFYEQIMQQLNHE